VRADQAFQQGAHGVGSAVAVAITLEQHERVGACALGSEIEAGDDANRRQVRVTKQRDLPGGDVFAFDLE
jgi:hypothetical protein